MEGLFKEDSRTKLSVSFWKSEGGQEILGRVRPKAGGSGLSLLPFYSLELGGRGGVGGVKR